jgi:hypothetical protein
MRKVTVTKELDKKCYWHVAAMYRPGNPQDIKMLISVQ